MKGNEGIIIVCKETQSLAIYFEVIVDHLDITTVANSIFENDVLI